MDISDLGWEYRIFYETNVLYFHKIYGTCVNLYPQKITREIDSGVDGGQSGRGTIPSLLGEVNTLSFWLPSKQPNTCIIA